MPHRIILNDGTSIPQLGLGVWQVDDSGLTCSIVTFDGDLDEAVAGALPPPFARYLTG